MTPNATATKSKKNDTKAATEGDAPAASSTPKPKLTAEQKEKAAIDKRVAAIAKRGLKNDNSLEKKFNPVWKEREAIAKSISHVLGIAKVVDVRNEAEKLDHDAFVFTVETHRNALLAALRGVRVVE